MNMDLVDRFALLEGFSEAQIDVLRPLIEDVRYEAQQIVFKQGDKADYLTEGDISIVNNVPTYDVQNSEINLTTYELGVVLTF